MLLLYLFLQPIQAYHHNRKRAHKIWISFSTNAMLLKRVVSFVWAKCEGWPVMDRAGTPECSHQLVPIQGPGGRILLDKDCVHRQRVIVIDWV